MNVAESRSRGRDLVGVYGPPFKSVFGALGDTYKEVGEALGMSTSAIGDKMKGRSAPGVPERVLLLLVLEAFGDDEDEMRRRLTKAIKKMKKMEYVK